jgi:uncharacterized protein (DUF58 family)
MGFRGPGAPGAKLAFAAVVAAALARIALASGDPVSLSFVGGDRAAPIPRSSGREQFERVVASLESVEPAGDARSDLAMLDRALQQLARTTRRGAIVVVLSDLVDLPVVAADRVSALASHGRALAVVQTLAPAEAHFPFSGTVRLRALEGGAVVETDAETTRGEYLAALAELTRAYRETVVGRGGRFVSALTSDDPVRVVRAIVQSLR